LKVKDIHATVVYILPPDEIPYSVLSRDETADRLGFRYGLAQEKPPIAIPGVQQNIVYNNGVFETDTGRYLIDRLVVEPRRVLITVNGETQVAGLLFDDVRRFFGEVDLRQADYSYAPVSTTHETQSTSVMNFEYRDIFSQSIVPSVQNIVESSIPSHGAQLDVYPVSIRFRIGYRNQPSALSRNRISLVDKLVTIELKDKTDPADRIMFFSTPADSRTHYELLLAIEELVTKQAAD
jgi:hypothetical protein